ncbi:transcriptional regulator, LysR family [Bordetella bronchiseptica 345]|nr:transcriptional regulator, LysR family [Bordetella bronchiseptica 345]
MRRSVFLIMKTANPPLVSLRAFVAVARHESFTQAAGTLGITQGAVSHHVATLETYADCRLFDRRGSTVALTPAGLQLYEAVKDAMSTIELTMQLLVQRGHRHDRLKVRTSMPSFAMTLVVPHLGTYSAAHGVQVDLITSLAPPQPQDEFDVLISRDLSLPGTESWELAREELICVGAPAVADAHREQSARHWPMVAARSRPDLIATWALVHDIAPDAINVVATYDHLFLAVTSAIGGTGFLVAPQLLVLDHLGTGTLVPSADPPIASGASYVAYVNAHSPHVQQARQFCRWLKNTLRNRGKAPA